MYETGCVDLLLFLTLFFFRSSKAVDAICFHFFELAIRIVSRKLCDAIRFFSIT